MIHSASRAPRWILALLSALSLAACAGRAAPALVADSTASRSVYVISNGWHTGLVLPRGQVSAEVWPEQGELGPAPYLEVGWGDSAAYLADRMTVRLALSAAFGSASAVASAPGRPASEYGRLCHGAGGHAGAGRCRSVPMLPTLFDITTDK
jgi:hypothetical protein